MTNDNKEAMETKMIDETFVKEKINPIVGWIFYSGKGQTIAGMPDATDEQVLREGTERIKALLLAAKSEGGEDERVLVVAERALIGIAKLGGEAEQYAARQALEQIKAIRGRK